MGKQDAGVANSTLKRMHALPNVSTTPLMRKLSWDEIERPSPEELADLPRHPIRVMVHNVRSIHNVGSIFRTSDAARVEHVYLTGFTGTPEHKDLHKTALGAQDTVPWSQHDDPVPVLSSLRDRGFTIAVLEQTDRSTSPNHVPDEVYPLCLVVGNEVKGVSQNIVELADRAVELPQFGAKISMNVGVAFGIAVYDLVRRYRTFYGPPEDDNRKKM